MNNSLNETDRGNHPLCEQLPPLTFEDSDQSKHQAHHKKHFTDALEAMPESGGGGCHPHLLRCANYAIMAGLDEQTFVDSIRPHIHGSREVSDSEITDAHRKGAGNRQPATSLGTNFMSSSHTRKPESGAPVVDFDWLKTTTEDDLKHLSPTSVPDDSTEMSRSFLQTAFRPEEMVFIGAKEDKGQIGQNIKTVINWLSNRTPADPFYIANPLTGEQGLTGSDNPSFRCDKAVADHKYLVVEFDESSPEQQRALCLWLVQSNSVVAITHSGGKSYHVLLKVNATDAEDYKSIKVKLKSYLLAIGADSACFNASRLTRLPGALRADKNRAIQRLIYLNDNAVADIDGLIKRFEELSQPKSKIIEEEIKKLLKMSPVELELSRKKIGKDFEISLGTIDKTLKLLEKAKNEPEPLFEEIEPWPEEVNGASILNEIEKLFFKHLVLEEYMAGIIALWVLLTYCYNSFMILPQLAVYSPVKRCGKTTLLRVLAAGVKDASPGSNLTPAVVYRVIDRYRPCLLIDEADTFLKDNQELQGIINSGHTKDTAYVWRVTGDNHDPTKFSTWGPKAIALIGRLGETQHDRSIVVSMRRKLPSETVEKVPLTLKDNCLDLRRKCTRWGIDNSDKLKDLEPDVPITGNDRQTDNWLPLFAIASCAGEKWPEFVKEALLEIAEGQDEEESLNIQLLRDIKKIFEDHHSDRILSADLVNKLLKTEDTPWRTFGYGRGLSQNSLARMLKLFKVRPKNVRQGTKIYKGYFAKQFEESFERYMLISTPLIEPQHRYKSIMTKAGGQFTTVTQKENVTVAKPRKTIALLDCSGVADEIPPLSEEKEKNGENQRNDPFLSKEPPTSETKPQQRSFEMV